MEKIIAELVLFILGGFIAVWPGTMVRFQIWIQRVLMNAQYIPSKRTYIAMRLIGLFLLALSFIVFIGVLK